MVGASVLRCYERRLRVQRVQRVQRGQTKEKVPEPPVMLEMIGPPPPGSWSPPLCSVSSVKPGSSVTTGVTQACFVFCARFSLMSRPQGVEGDTANSSYFPVAGTRPPRYFWTTNQQQRELRPA